MRGQESSTEDNTCFNMCMASLSPKFNHTLDLTTPPFEQIMILLNSFPLRKGLSIISKPAPNRFTVVESYMINVGV